MKSARSNRLRLPYAKKNGLTSPRRITGSCFFGGEFVRQPNRSINRKGAEIFTSAVSRQAPAQIQLAPLGRQPMTASSSSFRLRLARRTGISANSSSQVSTKPHRQRKPSSDWHPVPGCLGISTPCAKVWRDSNLSHRTYLLILRHMVEVPAQRRAP